MWRSIRSLAPIPSATETVRRPSLSKSLSTVELALIGGAEKKISPQRQPRGDLAVDNQIFRRQQFQGINKLWVIVPKIYSIA